MRYAQAVTRLALAAIVLAVGCGVTERPIFPSRDADAASRDPDEAPRDGGDGRNRDAAPAALPDAAGPPPYPDANFAWTETLPGQGTCRRARYVGSFGCLVSAGVVPLEIEGQIGFLLTGSEEEQTLQVADGMLSDLDGIFDATLDGRLDCNDRVFSGETSDGVAHALPSSTPSSMQGPTFRFAASFVARFDDQTLSMSGTWTMLNDLGGGCSGLWRAAAIP